MTRNIAISDIHGHLKTFKKLLEEKVILTKEDHLFLLGDLIHGPSVKGLIDYIFDLQERGFNVTRLMGNHEHILLKDVENGRRTMNLTYLQFFKSMKHYVELNDFVLVHAAFNLSLDFPPDDVSTMLWGPSFGPSWNHNGENQWLGTRKVIYGHASRDRKEIKRSLTENQLNIGIDNGVDLTAISGKGSLCALDFTNMKWWFQENLDRPVF